MSLTGHDPADLAMALDRDAILAEVRRRLDLARPEWHDRAACRTSPLDFTSRSTTTIAACIQICGRCDAIAECRAWADEIADPVAVLGGEDASARKARWKVRGINQGRTAP